MLAMTDQRVTIFPCIWCDRCVGCVCIVDEIDVRRARSAANQLHRQAVALARRRNNARRAAA